MSDIASFIHNLIINPQNRDIDNTHLSLGRQFGNDYNVKLHSILDSFFDDDSFFDNENKELNDFISEIALILGNYYSINNNKNYMMIYYHMAADKGSVIAINNIGTCYINGNGVERNYILAFDYFERAAKNDNCIALTNLGVCYFNGIGTVVDRITAAQLFQKASNFNYREATKYLAFCYRTGQGVEQDPFICMNLIVKVLDNPNNGVLLRLRYHLIRMLNNYIQRRANRFIND